VFTLFSKSTKEVFSLHSPNRLATMAHGQVCFS